MNAPFGYVAGVGRVATELVYIYYLIGMNAPLGYVAGVGRGATGFTTRYNFY